MKLIFFDIETTGLRVDKERITELAAYEAGTGRSFATLINPQVPIPEASTAINGITDAMVADAPVLSAVIGDFFSFCSPDFILVAHNGDSFDFPFLAAECHRVQYSPPTFRTIDTLKWARRYRPDLPRHTLQFLRETYSIAANQAHRALDDVMVLYQVYQKLTDDLLPDQVIALLDRTSNGDRMPFGKHQGKFLSEVPNDYLKWLMQSGALDKPNNKELREKVEKLLNTAVATKQSA